MAEEIRHPDGRLEHPGVRYEPSDASFRWILLILVGSMALASVIFAGILQFLYSYRAHQDEIKKTSYPLARHPANQLPLEPRLEQVDRMAGIETPNVYDRETVNLAVLNSYGSTDDEQFIHIPIERAMQLLLQSSTLKIRPKPSSEQERRSSGLMDAGESNSGRMFKGGAK